MTKPQASSAMTMTLRSASKKPAAPPQPSPPRATASKDGKRESKPKAREIKATPKPKPKSKTKPTKVEHSPPLKKAKVEVETEGELGSDEDEDDEEEEDASVLGDGLMPLPPELIVLVFKLGRFTQQEAAVLACVTRNPTWQACVRPILWHSLTVYSCWTGARRGLAAENTVFVHANKKAQAIRGNAELAKEVTTLRIRGDEVCKFCKRDTRKLSTTLEVIKPYVRKISIAIKDFIAKHRLPSLLRLIRDTKFDRLDTLEIVPDALLPAEPTREPVPFPGKMKAARNKKIKVPALTVGGFCNPLDAIHTAAYRLDFSYATTIALFEQGTLSIDMRTFKHVVSLDLQIMPATSAQSAQQTRKYVLDQLKEVLTLRELHLWFYGPQQRYTRTAQAQAFDESIYQDLHRSYPPNLEVLTFAAHTKASGGVAKGCVRLWRAFTHRIITLDTLDELATTITERLPKLKRLELPHIPRDEWHAARARVLTHPKIEKWLEGLSSDNTGREVVLKAYD